MAQAVKCWKEVTSYEDTYYLIDVGVVLKSRDLHHLNKTLLRQSSHDNQMVIEYFADRFIERYKNRESAEILIESLLLWLLRSMDEIYVVAFMQKILEHPSRNDIIYEMTKLLLSLDFVNRKYRDDAFDISVFLMTQFGIQLKYFGRLFPDEFGDVDDLIAHINAFMSSIANSSSHRVRQCLLNYFVTIHDDSEPDHKWFKRMMSRFGTTLFYELFCQLFEKKTQAYAFQYFVDNLPYILKNDDGEIQTTIHEILRHNMLKYPEKFAQFLQAYGPALGVEVGRHSRAAQVVIAQNYVKHMAMLLVVVSQVDHLDLSKELLISLCLFRDFAFSESMLNELKMAPQMKPFYRTVLAGMIHHRGAERTYIEGLSRFRCRKRGRKSKIEHQKLSVFQQVFCLK